MDWKEAYPKKTKPSYDELLGFFEPHIRELFETFDREVNSQFNVHNKYHRYSSIAGWTYGYGRSYNCELMTVTVHSDCFYVLGVSVRDEESLREALGKVRDAYESGFEDHYAAVSAKRRENQIARSKTRVEREQAQMEKLTEHVDPEKFNKFNWCKKVSRSDLFRLYQGEAKGLLDEDLLEDIGLTFYTRCTQAKEARELMEKGHMLCLHCGAVLGVGIERQAVLGNEPVYCECGYSYTYREYRRSCNAVNMPGGRATPKFEGFIKEWTLCKDASQKMMQIDRLIHECHVTLMSGAQGRSVCINLIEGSLKQIADLIVKLAN